MGFETGGFLVLGLDFPHAALEIFEALSDGGAKLGQFGGAKEDDNNDEDDNDFLSANAEREKEHGNLQKRGGCGRLAQRWGLYKHSLFAGQSCRFARPRARAETQSQGDNELLKEMSMRAVDLIEMKRDGKEIPAAEMKAFVDAVVHKEVPDYQAAAFLMAVYFRGMEPGELVAYTDAMLHSGDTFSLKSLRGHYKVDKHSTGGVGDKVSLTLAPMVAACGPVIPMISGRGLGHTGGTLDKLESIPGYRVGLSEEEIEGAIAKAGYVIAGQTGSLVPADKIFYALRDVTATVPSIELIAASIMSKKMSVGLDGLVLDVKVGSGAFMKTQDRAQKLADTMISIGRAMGCDVRACITSMDQPLGVAVGNANELIEAIEMLKGRAPADYAHIVMTLGTEMLAMAKKISNDDAREELERAISSGRALEQLRKNIEAQGGDPRVVDDYSLLAVARDCVQVVAPRDGYVASYQCETVGKAGCILGAGREVAGAPVDHSVGLDVLHKIGDVVKKGDPLFNVYYKDEKKCEEAQRMLLESIEISDNKPVLNDLVRDIRR